MRIILTKIIADDIIHKDINKVYLYGDFNVLNSLYKKKINLNKDILIYPDSSCIYFTLKYFYKYNVCKNVSTDIQYNLLNEALRLKKRVFFFGDSSEVLNKISNKFSDENSSECLAGLYPGYNYDNKKVLQYINKTNPDILFIGLGAGRQENWINENYKKLKVRIIISTGGWFQYLADVKRRAPYWMRKGHLEWLFKLINEFPDMWKRYLFGIPAFFLRVLSKKIILELK